MKYKKIFFVLGVFLTLIGACITASAETDATNDLFHRKQDESDITGWAFEEYTGEKPNIDITDISYTTTDTQLMITMTVVGTIEDKEGLAYYTYIVRDTVGAGNFAFYTNGYYYVWGDTFESAESEFVSHAGTNTITFTMNYSDPAGIVGVWGYTYEVTDPTAGTEGEYWGDWAPDSYFPAYDLFYGGEDTGEEDTGEEDTGEEDTGEEDTGEEETNGEETTGEDDNGEEGGGGTPGFELLVLIAAIAVALIILRKRR